MVSPTAPPSGLADRAQRQLLVTGLALVVFATSTASSMAARRPTTATTTEGVPIRVAQRLLAHRNFFYASSSLEIEVGRAPDALVDFVPDDAVAIANAKDANHSLVLLDVPRSRWIENEEDLAATFIALLAESEFRLTNPESDHGFVAFTGSLPMFFCRDTSDSVWIALEEPVSSEPVETAEPDAFRVVLRRTDQRFCDPVYRARIWGNPKGVPVPLLVAPPEVEVSGGGQSSGANSASLSSRLTDAPQTPGELTTHFADQLFEAGWSLGPVLDQGAFAFVTATRMSPEQDRAWFALLQIRASGDQAHTAELDIRAVASPPEL